MDDADALLFRWREREPPYEPRIMRRPLDLPSLTVTASGLAGAARGQVLLDVGVPLMPAPVTSGGKPPYRVPLLSEIRKIPHNGLNVVSTFGGAGGSSTGYRMAGYRVLAAVEFVPKAQESYAANMAEYTHLFRRDVRDVEAEEILEAIGLAKGELDVFDGSPPCEPFSSAGQRDKKWNQVVEYSGQRQRTDDLFFEYARLVDGLRPKVFVAENVEGLVKGRAKGYFIWILAKLRSLGYRVEARVLDAQWLGVPQVRKRVIFVGVREDLGVDPAFPAPLPYNYSTREAIADLIEAGARIEHDTGGQFGRKGDISEEVSPTVVSSGAGNFKVVHDNGGANQAADAGQADEADGPSRAITTQNHQHLKVELQEVERRLGGSAEDGRRQSSDPDDPSPTIIAKGGSEGDTTNGVFVEFDQQIVGNEAFEPVFGSLDQPSPTIMAGGARTSGEVRSSVTRVRRKLTIPEVKRLSGFPDDYELVGSFAIQWERCGDCVPPPMMAAVAATIRDKILKEA